MNVAELLDRHEAYWVRATRHDFLSAVRDGTMPEDAFDVWLTQDYLFAAELLRFQARLLSRVPRAAQPVLAAGLVALVDELAWFEDRAAERHIDLAAEPLPASEAYGRLLERLDRADVAIALSMLWALERAYLDAWAFAAPGAPAYREFVAHWTTPQFGAYVGALEKAANAARPDLTEVDVLFTDVVKAEARFWDMAWDRGT